MRTNPMTLIAGMSLLLAGCGMGPAKIAVGKYPDIDVNTAILFTSRDHRDIEIRKIVINEKDVPGCVWPSASGNQGPHLDGTRNGLDSTDYKGPIAVGLGGGFAMMGFSDCGQPVEVTIESNYGSSNYEVGGS